MLVVVICWFTYRNAFHTYVQNTSNSAKGKRLVPSKTYLANWIVSDKKFLRESYKNLDNEFKSSGDQTEFGLWETPQVSKEN